MTQRRTASVPTDCWYAVAESSAVGRSLTALRALDRPVVLYRTEDGRAVALEDRCAHRAYPLSAGALVGDDVRCGLCGFVYDVDGQCVGVPTQSRVPFGASVSSYPVQESAGVVWVWFGEPGRSRLHRVPELPWLGADGWASVSGEADVAAGYLLLHESFADVTQVPFVAPEISPTVLGSQPPPLDVVVTETTVSLHREFAPAPLPQWQAAMLGVAADVPFATSQEGFFLSPAAWVDHWDVTGPDGRVARLRFTQLVTPLGAGRSRVMWRVSRDFAVGDAQADGTVAAMFRDYYGRVMSAMETAQRVLDVDGPGPEVNVSADVAAVKVREIVTGMLAEETPYSVVRTRRARV
ncbi:MAG: Rieske 2Fe-2S domain-containing protein [Frankiales bacterium]|nr:Rieske 2Fe-2S domain-containing protein [Frankiales bacterium]